MGWTILPPVAHGLQPLLWPGPTASLRTDETAFEAFEQFRPDPARFSTPRNTEAMRWRYAARSGLRYGWASLQQAETPNAIIYRVTTRLKIRLLVVTELMGTPNERRALIRSAARREGALAVLAAVGEGASPLLQGPAWRRGNSVVAVRPLSSLSQHPLSLTDWALTLGDLERVI